MIQPNLFLIGAPKCGTSSLFDWLSQHPDIRGSKVKETFALIDPAHPLARRPSVAADGQEAYTKFFQSDDAEAFYRMDATTHYLYDDHARQAIAAMPDARVIVVLREPATRVLSSFRYTANNLARLKKNITFSDYIRLVESQESLFPRWCNHPGSAFVLERDILYSRYHIFIQKWLMAIDRHNIHFVTMESMIQNPYSVISNIFSWLGIDPVPEASLAIKRKNSTSIIRNKIIHRLVRNVNSSIQINRHVKSMLLSLYSLFQFKDNSDLISHDERSIAYLKQFFAADNEKLRALNLLDLSCWH